MTDQATTHYTLITQLHLSNPVNKHARNQTTAGRELSLCATQIAVEYTGFYMPDTVMAMNEGFHSSTFETTRKADSGERVC
jgi:hypothetical protein